MKAAQRRQKSDATKAGLVNIPCVTLGFLHGIDVVPRAGLIGAAVLGDDFVQCLVHVLGQQVEESLRRPVLPESRTCRVDVTWSLLHTMLFVTKSIADIASVLRPNGALGPDLEARSWW